MDRDTARREIKSRYAEYLKPAKTKVNGRPTYICPLCGNGTGKDGDGMAIDPKSDGTRLKCFKCGFYGDIIDLYEKEHNCGAKEAFNDLYKMFNIIIDDRPQERTEKPTEAHKTATGTIKKPVEEKPLQGEIEATGTKDFTGYYKSCREAITDPIPTAYLSFRGISEATASRYYIGFDREKSFLIIPVTRSFYIARNTDAAASMRYSNPTGESVELFNLQALYSKDKHPVFITEGTIDALSIIEAGGVAVGLNSSSNTRKILDHLKEKSTDKTLIVCLDNDTPGKAAAQSLTEGLKELSIDYITADIAADHNDPNEALTADRAAFIARVQATERHILKPDNTADYIRQSMAADISILKAQADRKTGFTNLDREQGSIYSGLYVIGGISSVGKTTFISQICDQMAGQGQHVLFFSMEQSRLEMISKSIARQTAKDDATKAVSSLQIRIGAKGEAITRAINEYSEAVGDRISILAGNFDTTVGFIRETIKKYMAFNSVRPCVIVDYLQVLQAQKDPETGRKTTDTRQKTDENITELKRISRDYEIPVFVISSLNRGNYLTPIDFESFKESGGIEYSCDVLWGLQLAAIHEDIFAKDNHVKEKRERMAQAKEEIPRQIELVCLKNRYGKSRYSCRFTYYPQYDLFTEADDKSNITPFTGKPARVI